MNGMSLIIPAFNEEEGIGRVLDRLAEIRPTLPCPVEVIVVDDGSTDQTAEVARAKQAVVVSHPVNLGYGASLKRGIERATHDWIGIVDSDGTYDIGELRTLLAQLDGYDMIIGARQGAAYRGTFLKYPMRVVFRWLCVYVTGTRVPDVNSGFRLFRKDFALSHQRALSSGYSFTTSLTMLSLLEGCVVGFVPIHYAKRLGRSKVRVVRDVLRSSQILLEIVLMYNPLKVFLLLGVVPLIAGILFMSRASWIAPLMVGFACLIWALGGVGVLLSRRNR